MSAKEAIVYDLLLLVTIYSPKNDIKQPSDMGN